MTQGCDRVSWHWPKVISPRSKCTHTQNPCPGHNSLLPSWIWIILHTMSITQRCIMTLTQGHTSNLRLQCTHTQNQCPGYNSSLPCWIWIISHTIVVHDPRICHDLDPRSYFQGQGANIPKIGVRTIARHCHIWSGYSHDCCPLPKGVMISTQGHTSKVKVTVYTYRNLYLGHNSSLPCWFGWYFTQLLSDSRVSWPWLKVISPRSMSQCTHTRNPYLGHNSLQSNLMGIILHLIVVHDTGCCCRGYLSRWDMSSLM